MEQNPRTDESNAIADSKSLNYMDIAKALLWDIEKYVIEGVNGVVPVARFSLPDAASKIEIDPDTAIRFEWDEPVETVNADDHDTIITWLAAGFSLTISRIATAKAS